jgi:hypothetical protein
MTEWEGRLRILALWSAPRCRSTAFFRMMLERGDFTVLHEPFSHVIDFGAFDAGCGIVHSVRELIDALRRLSLREQIFFKDTTDSRCPDLLGDVDFLRDATHTFLIRHPKEAIASHYDLDPNLGRDEIGFAWLHEIYSAVREVTGEDPIVLDAQDLVRDPEETVREYCRRIGIPFIIEAMSWRADLLDIWRPNERWYTNVSQSSGFELRRTSPSVDVEAHPRLAELLAYHLPFYEEMCERRIRV